jgi:hypothetical protein
MPRPFDAAADRPDPDPGHGPGPVNDAIDPMVDLSPTPATPIEAVAGVGDRSGNLSLA